MYEDERLKKIEQLLIKHDGILQNLYGKDEAQKRFMRDLMTNLDEDNVPSLRLKVTSGQMTAAIEAYATEAEAAIDLKLTGYYTAAALDLMITDVESNISLVAKYTGQDGVITVSVWNTSGKDTTKVYFATDTGKYYKYNGTAWVPSNNISEASFLMSAINGESTIKIKADQIVNTGTVSFLDTIGLEAGTTKIKGGWLETDTIATNALKKRAGTGSLAGTQWLDFHAGIDMTAINEKDTSYYPDTRQLIGLKSLRLHRDTSLTDGHGDASNTLYEIGSLQIGATSVNSLSQTWTPGGIDLTLGDSTSSKALQVASSGAVVVNSGMAYGQSGEIHFSAYNNTVKTSGYQMRITGTGIALYKYTSGAPTLLEQWA